MAAHQQLLEEQQSNLSSFPSTPRNLPIVWRREAQKLHSIGIAQGSATREGFGELISKWSADARTLRRYGVEALATTLDECSRQLRAVTETEDEALLSLKEASALCGYTPDHLGRLIREEKLANHASKHRPKVRRGDLPKKCSTIARGGVDSYSPETDARSLLESARMRTPR